MQFSTSLLGLVASAVVANAAKVTFWTLDDQTRTVHFTSNPSSADLDSVTVVPGEKKTVDFPDEYTGNFYAIPEGKDNVAGMLGEVNFSGWKGMTYFDVSGIVDPSDKSGVHQMWPADSQSPMSGCQVFPCDNAYWHPHDVQTKVTTEFHIITTLGEGDSGVSSE